MCQCICFFLAQKTLTLSITLNHRGQRFHIWHAFSANETFSNDTKVSDTVTLNVSSESLKMAVLDFVAARSIHVSRT